MNKNINLSKIYLGRFPLMLQSEFMYIKWFNKEC